MEKQIDLRTLFKLWVCKRVRSEVVLISGLLTHPEGKRAWGAASAFEVVLQRF